MNRNRAYHRVRVTAVVQINKTKKTKRRRKRKTFLM